MPSALPDRTPDLSPDRFLTVWRGLSTEDRELMLFLTRRFVEAHCLAILKGKDPEPLPKRMGIRQRGRGSTSGPPTA